MPTDLYWSADGDFSIDQVGDLRDTSFDPFYSTYQEIRTRVSSGFRDWATQPSLGADLESLVGRPSSKLTAEDGKTKIINSLTLGGFLRREQIKVRYLPLSKDQIAYFIEVAAPSEDLIGSKLIKTQFLFDFKNKDLRML
jgi:hypothetical protein